MEDVEVLEGNEEGTSWVLTDPKDLTHLAGNAEESLGARFTHLSFFFFRLFEDVTHLAGTSRDRDRSIHALSSLPFFFSHSQPSTMRQCVNRNLSPEVAIP